MTDLILTTDDIDLSGATDNTSRFNNKYAEAQAAGKRLVIPNWSFRADYTIYLRSNSEMWSDPGFGGCTIYTDHHASDDQRLILQTWHDKPNPHYDPARYDAARAGYKAMRGARIQNFTATGVKVRGPHRDGVPYSIIYESQHGWWLQDHAHVHLVECFSWNHWGDWLNVGDAFGTVPTDTVLEDCGGRGCGRQGFVPNACDGLTISGGYTGPFIERTAWDFEGFGSATRRNILIEDHDVYGPCQFMALHGEENIFTVRLVRLHGLPILVNGQNMKGPRCGPIAFEDITSDTEHKSSLSPFTLPNAHDVTIKRVHQQLRASKQNAAVSLKSNRGAYCVPTSGPDANSFPGARVAVEVVSGVDPGNCTAAPPPVQTLPPTVVGPIFAGATSCRGTGKPGAAVQVIVNGVATGATVTVDANGNWSRDSLPAFTDGQAVTAKQTGLSELESIASDAVTVTVQPRTHRPVVVSPINTDATAFTATSGEPDGTSVQFYIDGVAAGDPVPLLHHTVTKTEIGPLTAGQVVTAKGTAPNKTQSAASDSVVVVDPISPEQTEQPVIMLPVYADATVVSGASIENGATVTLYDDGTPVGTDDVVGGAWSVSDLTLVVGHSITAKAQASGKSLSEASDAAVVRTRAKTVRPWVVSPIFLHGQYIRGYSEPGASVELFTGATSLGVVQANRAGRWWKHVTARAAGEVITARATVTDQAVSDASDPVTVLAEADPARGGGGLGYLALE